MKQLKQILLDKGNGSKLNLVIPSSGEILRLEDNSTSSYVGCQYKSLLWCRRCRQVHVALLISSSGIARLGVSDMVGVYNIFRAISW